MNSLKKNLSLRHDEKLREGARSHLGQYGLDFGKYLELKNNVSESTNLNPTQYVSANASPEPQT